MIPVAVKDLDPVDYPKIPSVRDIAIPPQVKMAKLGVVTQIMKEPIPLVVIESDQLQVETCVGHYLKAFFECYVP